MFRILLALFVVVAGSLGVVTVIANSGPAEATQIAPPPRPPRPASIAYAPTPAAANVDPRALPMVNVASGKLNEVTLTGPDGPVPGAVTGSMWSATSALAYNATYTWSGSATGEDGATVPLQGSFTTVNPERTVRGTINIGDGRTVGVAAPIRIQFNRHVDDRVSVERALSVQTSVPVEGSWGWLPDENGGSRVDWRPKDYWPAHTQVTVKANLFGVRYGGGAYGASNITSTFQIGRSQIVKADAASHRVLVIRDGQQVADYLASYGLDSDPNRNTRSGIHVVTEKFTDKRMVSERYGYDLMEKWAVRISNNGEFIHANPASSGAQGSSNVSHGCVNLSTADAKAYYDTALYGDPVEVSGTGVQLSAKDGDIWDWTLPWDEWKALSSLT